MSYALASNITPLRPDVREDIIAESPAMRALLEQVERLASVDLPVVLFGETGVGKEVVAKALHSSSRRSGTFVAVNCAALPETLIESELFGHTKGAFTGAERDRPGLFAAAHGGTLFLDEVAELPLQLQAKLLRALEEGAVRRVGSTTTTRVEARIVSATNRDLALLVDAGQFREDLYHRLAGVTLTIAPLRDRPQDFAALFHRYLVEACAERGEVRLAPGTIEELVRRPWRGNVRELRQAVRRAVALGGEVLSSKDFLPSRHAPESADVLSSWIVGKRWVEIERSIITLVLEREGSIRGTAAALGIAKSTLADRLRALRIPMPGSSSPRRRRPDIPHHAESIAADGR